MNKKTFIIIGVFICLLFAIPMASATDVDVHNGLAIESAAADFSMDAVNNASVEDSNSIVSNAADSSDSNIIPDNNNLSGIQYDSADVKNSKTLAASNDNVLGADGTGNTFADLQYLIDHASETLTLDRDFNFVSGSDDDHANGIIINNTLTINGGGHTIDAKNLARIFNISASNVQLNNLILINGKSAENGGAIYIQTQGGKTNLENITLKFCEAENGGGIYTVTPTAMKNITAINCTATGNGGAIFAAADGTDVTLDIFNLYNNTAVNGGALYTHGDNIKITNVDAQNNTASGQGGAVYAYGNHLTLDGIKFIRNHAGINPTDNSSGGAIYFDTSNDSIVNHVLFDNNYATKNGGAIAWARGSYFGELYNSNFTNNSAGRSGGAVRWVGDNGTVENCTFTDNRANGTNRDHDDYYEDGLVKLGGSGGAVIWLGSIGYIKNSNFTDNYAALNGGAAFFRAESDTDPCNDTHIIGCNFINNNAESNGGAIGWNDRASHGSLQDSVLINNTAGRSGGAVFWKGSNGTITNSNFTSNHANGTNLVQPPGFLTEGGNGGAIIITGSDVNITYSKFVNNTARARGGAVYLQNNSNTLILNSTFEENFAGTNGGALDFYQGAANGRVINSTFLHNMANKTGGSIYWNGHNGVINGSLFRDNIALNQGTELNGTPITDAGDGGAVIWTGSYGVIENTTFTNNTANRRGGAIYLLGESNTDGTLNYCENVTVKNCTFDSNIARTNGGAIDWFKGARYGTVEDSVFINNIANRTGGAIFWNGINGTVRKSNFTNNTAKGQEYGITPYGKNTTGGDGGAIMWSGSNGLIDECNFDNNSAKWRGGAMFLQRYDDNILCENTTVSNSNFTFNHAGSNGGAIEWTLGARYGDLVNSTFINNTADRSGGAVFWYGMYGDINGSTFINNSAIGNYTPGSDNRPDVSYLEDGQYSGGAVYVRGDHTVIYNDTFLINSVPRQGGAIFIKGENATIDKCNFTNHTSQLDGGAIYVDGNITHISNSSFVNNTAETGHGGAIYWEGFNGTVESSNFTHNNNQKGGAIYIDGNLTKINDCNFTNNTATQGGAILVQGNNATINLSNFIGHHTDEEGGAIYVNGTSTCIDNSTFTNNTSHDDGGAIAWWGDNGTVFNVTCLNNSGTSEGHTSSGGTISIYGSNIVMDRLNVTEGYVITRQDGGRERIARGGAIFLTGNNVTISNSTFTNCSVNSTWESGLNNNESDGGAMYIIGNETKLINVTLEDCLAHDGGAIYWMGNDGYADKLNASGCNATDAGGVMYISGNNVTVSNSTFNNNTAWDDGAAIDWIGNEGKMFNVTASDNKGISKGHTSKGGTFSIEGNDTDIDTVNVSNSYITGSGDKPPQGGGMFVSGNNANITNVVFTNCSVNFTGNLAGNEEASGGAIYIVGNNTNIVDGSFSQNSAYADGGAIFVAGENCTMNNTNFTDNVAHNDGGAIQIEGNNAKIYNLTADSNYADSRSGSSQGGTLIITGNRTSMELINISNSYVDGISGRNSIRGGAIFLTGNDCNISNASFTNCSVKLDATNCSGGAIYIIGNNTNITNVNFTNNTSPQDGGAIYVTGTNFILDGGNFTNNTAKLRGGAIFLTDNKESKILNSYFESNYAGRNGGAIDFYAGAEDGLVSNCGFVNNTAGASGGSIFWEGTRGIVEYSNFTGSRAWGNNTESSGVAPNKGRGGSIIWLGDRGEIRECVFDDSESLKEGSALYIIGNDFAAYNSNVTNSVSNQSSGTIYIQGTYAKIGDCYMDNNTVKDKGAGIYVKGNFVSISGTTINNSTSGDVASAVYVEGNRTEIKDSLISNNVANKSGAVYIAGSRSTVTNVNFENNTAKTSAGAIYISGDDTIVTKSNFTNNTAFKGGAILYEGQRITISYSNFDKNRANGTSDAKGGSISIKGKSGDSIIGCNFTDSSSGSSGGSIHWLAGGEGGLIQNCTFINSSTDGIKTNGQGHGGAIIWEANLNGVIDNCTFIKCEAKGTKNAGAIYIGTSTSSATNPVISNCTVINCTNGERGVINIYGSNATLFNITFVNMSKESSTSDKGFHAIEFEKLTTGRVINCTFENIGGCYDGGAIKVDSGSDIVIANNTFINVSTKRNGGAFYSVSVSGQQIFENNTFINCSANNSSATTNGGAAYFNNKVTSFKNNTFINCSLSTTNGRGGAVYLLVEGIVIDNSTFINSSGAVQGGAVFSSKAITINNSYFESNMANAGTSNVQGGAVFTDGGNIIVNNSTFIANSALHSGGALYAKNNKDIIVSNSTFLHNTAPGYDGGAIYTGGNVYINESSTLMYNNASSASAIKAKSVYINDTVLLENQAHFRQWADQRYNLKNDHVSINGTLRGNDLLLNAIVADNYGFKNVVYCGENGEETNTDDVTSALSYNEVHILVLLEVYNAQNELIDTVEQYTDANGHYTFDFDLVDASNHSFKVIHPEDNYYTGAEYTIGKALSDLVITSQNITHPEDENISFQVTGGLSDIPSGNITVIINDTNGNIIYNDTISLNETGEAAISLPRLNATEYYIYAKYNGDDNYLPDNGTDVFHVSMGESFINIGIENYTYNETRNITITIPYIEDGKVTVIVSNENYTQLYTVYITEGTEELEIELPILDAGEYQIDAVFHGNNNYFPSENQTNFTVFKAASIINVTAENVTGGEHAVANIHIDPEVATQTVDVVVKDEAGEIVAEFEGLGLLNSATSITLPVLPKGKYNVTVSYGGDKNHNESVNSTIFYVTRDLFPIEINASNMTYGENQVINITVPADADPDKLWIKLNWTGNDTVTHLGYTIDPETGLIQIDTSALTNRLDAGNYTIDVYYEGDDDYLSNSSSFTFEVIKANVTMTVTPENITYGAIENITVEIPELNEIGQNDALTLYVNSTTNESIRFVIEDYDIGTDGKAIWNVLENILPAGDYIVDAVYAGSNNYNPTNRTERFTVSKAAVWIEIDVNNIFVDDTEVINVTVHGVDGGTIPSGEIKIIVRTIDDKYELNATGQYSISLPNEVEGTAISVTVIYYGDNNYNGTDNTTDYNVTRKNTTTTVDALTPIKYGTIEDLNMTVNYTDAIGTITLYINSTVEGFDNITKVFTLDGTTGKVNWDIDELILPVGTYEATAVYSGDRKYFNSTSQIKLIVVEQNDNYEITVEANNTVYREDQVIVVTVPEDANGTVTIVIVDTDISLTKQVENGQAVFTIPSGVYDFLEVHDDYNVTATYNGDANYVAGKTANDLFNVTKADSEIIVIPTDIYYKESEPMVINITVANASGKVNVTIVNKTSGEEIDSWIIDPIVSGETSIDYTAKLLEAGNYTVKVEYYGDHNYNNDTDEKDFEVRKINTTISEVSPDIVYGDDETITVTIGDSDASGTVVVKIGDVEVDNKTIGQDELVFVIEKPLADPQYNITVIYSGDNNYNDATITGVFAVNKTVPTIDLDVNNIFVGDDEVINVTVIGIDGLAIPTGNVTILVRSLNETRILNASAGASLTLENEVEGTGITVIVFYNGDDNYNATSISKHYNVTKRNTTTAISGQTPIPYGAIENLTITVNETAITGTVTVYINSTVERFENITKVFTITEANHNVIEWNIDEKVLKAGEYNVTAIYSGDNKFFGSNGTYVFVVEQNDNYEIAVEANNTVYREGQVIVVTVPDDAEGTVTITIAGTEISLTEQVVDGKAVFTIPSGAYDFLEVHDDYNVTATYNGDANYAAGKTADDLFNVTKADSHVDVIAQNITYSQVENITVSLPDINASGKLVITINNSSGIVRTQTVDLFSTTDGVIYPFADLTAGNYTVKVVYSDDHNYKDSEDSYDFEVSKADPTLSENSPDIIYGNNENITVSISGVDGGLAPTGTIEVKVDGVTVDTIEIGNDLEYIVIKPGVDPRHNVTVVYSGDSNYNSATIYGEFAVTQNTTEMEEDSPNIVYGHNETITITLPNDATGTVYLVVNDTYYAPIGIDDNHQAVFTIVAPVVGNYNFTAYYSGDGNYTANNIRGAFNVTKADVSLSETHVATITYGANNTITVTITGVEGPEGVLAPTGTIKVLVDGTEIGNITIGESLVFTSIKPFVDPQHNITVVYSGDNNYNDKTIDDGTFEVIQNTTVEISEVSPDINYGENETITVTIVGDATGTITVKIGEETVGTFTIAEDNITEEAKEFTFTKVKPDGGVYDNLIVEYGGDKNYAARTITGEFTVSPIDPNITEESPDIVYTNNETIAITVPEGATGTLTVTVKNSKDETIETKELVIGTDDLVVLIEKPDVDNYTISIDYSGCANYTAKTITGEFEVTKASNEITVVPTNITYGQTETITVTVPEGATGNVTITIGSYTDTLNITVGLREVVFTIPKTAVDELLKVNENYVVFANYSGDGNFESAIANAPFHVDPANTTTTIQVANITYGEDEIINITVTGVAGGEIPSGFVTITLNGTDISITKRVDAEGKVQFNVTGLVVGEYTVNATFESSSINYNDSNANAAFNVTKADVKVENRNITAINITYGDDETITVVLNETNITGNVTITINGTEIETKELEDGKAVFVIPSALVIYLEVNGYNVIANYSGDDNYNGFTIDDNLNADFKVDKANVTVDVNPVDIIYKETEEINVTVAGVVIDGDATDIVTKYNLTGKVTIYIDGVENQTKAIGAVDENGVLHFYVEGLAVGMHNVTAKYWDDRNYNDNNLTKDFEVINALPEDMKVIPQNITYHIQNETITVDLGEVLNGTVQLYINETLVATFEVVDQSSVSYTNATLAVGNYTAKSIFTANKDSVEASANFTVSKAPTTVSVNAENSTYGDTQTITVTVDNTVGDKFNLTGNISISINGVDYGNKTVDANGQAVFEIDGLEANENYVVIATYYNDPNYLDNNGQDTFKVSKADVKDTNKNITAINITYGEDETITVTLNEDNITGKVTITINGSEIDTKELEDGKAVFTVKDLEVNGYNVVANYSGDVNYNPFTIADNLNTDFTVGKANSTIEVEAIPSIVYGNNETITVTVPIRNHTGTVTLTINGTDYEFIKHLTAEDGDAIVLTNVSGLAVGLYNVTVKYEGDRNYNDSENSTLFEVTQAEPASIVVEPQNITYGQIENITVTVSPVEGYATPTGNVTITIVGTDIVKTLNLTDGTVTFNIPDLAVDTYVVEAAYSGDANYTALNGMNVFKVSPAASNVTIEVANITYGDTEYANITIPNSNASGRVIITVDGQTYQSGVLTNDTPINLALDNLAVGEHTIDVEYFNDHNYNDSSAHAVFTVSPANSSVIIVTQNITYQDIENITVTVPVNNATGTLVVRINGSEVNRTKFNGENSPEIVINVPGLAVGEYNVTAEYIDDVNYNNSDNSSIFHVDKANITDIPGYDGMTVVPTNITYLDNETVVVTVDVPNATGLLTITINGTAVVMTKNITEDGSQSVTFIVPGLAVGEYNVTASYHDDANYNDANASALFHVSPLNSTVTVVPTNITYLDNETIAVSVPIANASGKVVVKVDGNVVDERTVTGDNPSYEISVSDLAAGEHNVTVEYFDDVNYNNSSVEANFTVSKRNITDVEGKEGMTLLPTNITYLDNETVVVTVDVPNVTGLVTITINGTDVAMTKNITENNNGSVTFTVPGLAVGEYNVTASYHDDANYNDASASALFNVSPANSTVTVSAVNITYGDNETITVTVPITNASGNVVVKVDGNVVDERTVSGDNPSFEISVSDLAAGEHNVTVEYFDDVNYNNSSNSTKFNVSKANITDINLTALNITYGENGTVTITINDKNATGNITIKVNGTEYGPEELVDGTISFNVPNLVAGDYNVTAYYSGDDNYNATEAQTTFNVDKATPTVYAVGTNITYGSEDQITVIVDGKNITGNVTIFIDGDEIDTKDLTQISTGGRAVFNVPGLTGGNHTVVAVYNGDDNHYSSSGEDNFTVSKVKPSVDVNATNIDYGEVENITITVNPVEGGENPTGNVTVTVTYPDGSTQTIPEVPIVDGNVTIPVDNLPAGDYKVNVTYNGDGNYNESSASGSFSVGRIAPAVDVSCVNITYGENETITVTVTGADGKAVPTGTVNITVNGQTYTDKELTDGKVTITVPGLTPNTYPVEVSYSGDENYTAQTGYGEFVVSKANATMKVNTTNIDYGETETITVNITGSGDGVLPTGKVNITVTDKDGNNRTFEDVEIVDGVANVNATDLPAGDYDVTVTYPGDDNYNATTGTGSFSVGRIAPAVDVSCVNITYGENETITVTVTGADGKAVPTGTVNITVNGHTYEDQELIDGKVTISVPGLAPNTYPVEVSYSGDENYTAQTGNGEFVVSKANATMKVNTTNIDYGETETITVNITGSGDVVLPTGTVNITVTDKDGNNKTFTDVPIEDGVAKVNATDLPAGDYDVTVTYPGDDNYNATSATGSFSVSKVDPVIDLETKNITYGEEETIKVTLDPVDGGEVPTGTVNITVTDKNGIEHPFVDCPVNDGVAEIKLSDLAAGNYTVEAKYSGDGNYNGADVSGKFEVKKAVPHINIYVYDIIYGDIEELRVTCDAPGYVDVIVNDVTITVSLDNGYEHRLFATLLGAYSGKAQVDLENLAVGTYPAIARYNETENYTSASDEDVFHVIKANTTTKISVDDIKVGEDAVINIEVDHDSGSEKINANITVTVDGTDYTVELKDGKGTLTVPGLSAGTHTVNATYPGSHNYTESSNKTSFKVSKHDSTIKITTDDIKVGDDETITVKVPKDATGNVTITVNGKDYTAPVKNGKATFTIPGLKAGTYAVNASYSGDDKYKSSKEKGTFKVSKIKPSVDVVAPTIHEGEDGIITVEVPDDATGTITIEIDGRKYTSRIKNGKAVFHISGLSPGKHNIKVYYSGDDKYQSRSVDGGVIKVIGDNHGGNHSKHGGINLSDKKTGNPLIMLVLVFFALVIVPFKRSKKDDDEEDN